MAKFQKGNGLSKGRPLGSRNRLTLLLEAIGQQSMVKTLQALARKAERGDVAAARLLVPLWLRLMGNFVKIDLPAVVDAASLAEAQGRLLALSADEELGLDQAGAYSNMLENRRRALETSEIEKNLRLAEAAAEDGSK